MRRLARRLVALCSAVSLALCVLTLLLWRDSYAASRNLFMAKVATRPGGADVLYFGINCVGGDVLIGNRDDVNASPALVAEVQALVGSTDRRWGIISPPGMPGRPLHRAGPFTTDNWGRRGWLGFGSLRPWGLYDRGLRVPLWFPAAVLGILPTLWLVRRPLVRRRFRRQHGLCPACGYDLRASPKRCPECGASRGGPTENR